MIGLLIGRFQPFHLGHLYLMRESLKHVEKLKIGIGSVNVNDEDNPLDFETRRRMIELVCKKEGLDSKVSRIFPINDYHNDEKWLKETLKNGGDFDLVIGNNEWTNGIFERAGYKILRVPFYKRHIYEGIKIRKLIQDKKKWEDRVPDYVIDMIKNYLRQESRERHV